MRTIDQEILDSIEGVWLARLKGSLENPPIFWASRYYQSVKELPTILVNDDFCPR
jgi:hypothetical protein